MLDAYPMSEPPRIAPANAPPRPSVDALPPLPTWSTGGEWPVSPPLVMRPSDLPTEDLKPEELLAAPEPKIVPGPPISAIHDGPTRDLGIPRPSDEPDGAVHTTVSVEPESRDERRTSRRHRLVGAAVRAAIHDPSGEIDDSRGRVRDISADGGLFVETRAPLPHRAVVRVAMAVSSSQAMRLTGTVVRVDEDGMAIHLRVDDEVLGFLNVFVAVARESHKSGSLEIRVDRAPSDAHESADIVLARVWHEVRSAPADAAAHRRFLDACVSAQRLDFATDRLRELKASHPDVPEVERALEQVGRVLGFVALARAPKVADAPRRVRPYVVVGALVLGGLLMLGALAKVQTRAEPHRPAAISTHER